MISAVILCAGSSTRMNHDKNKVLLPLGDIPMFMHSVEKLSEFCDDVVVVSNAVDYEEIKAYFPNVVLGGATRQESVYEGIKACKHNTVLVHDGARPFVSSLDLKRIVEASKNTDLAFLGSYLSDSIKDSNFNNLNREGIILAYTPQLVKKDQYNEAYQKAVKDNKVYTDDVTLVSEGINIKPQLIIGEKTNIKITTIEDYQEALCRVSRYRVGHSWDIHKLVSDRKLVLGGIDIPFEKGLLGHSDADVILHAISESLLGALALGDLGTHFPDNDPKYKNMNSTFFLLKCYEMIHDAGYDVNNIDIMVYAERPKMKEYIPLMRENIASLLRINVDQVSIKATTYEGMAEIGRGEAIACDSFVLLKRIN